MSSNEDVRRTSTARQVAWVIIGVGWLLLGVRAITRDDTWLGTGMLLAGTLWLGYAYSTYRDRRRRGLA